ncbi:hypothetical protein [Pseudomonas coronafaciens]|uniref:hypothetical protein n=1 Tax=Pseudomonas coronafaciens TaxID=53409 RepID=UPI000F1A0902|nr:hypothetical protein [Pseudomonas coronafaciens]RMV70327.1 hypothetical protein ALP06_00432 [Pseudomonas coronafaciens pv. atropurpurea]
MSRTGARDRARRQLTETLAVLNDSVALLGKSRGLIENAGTQSAFQYLADLDAFCARIFPGQVHQHPDNLAVDNFAAAMKTKLAEARAKGLRGWSETNVQDRTLAEMLVGHIPKGNPGNFEDIANFAMMLHQRDADPMELTFAYNAMLSTVPTRRVQSRPSNRVTTKEAMAKERPILFNGPMTQALLAGQKTVMRRLVETPPGTPNTELAEGREAQPEDVHTADCPYGQPGERLWVRETWIPCPDAGHGSWSNHTCGYSTWVNTGKKICNIPAALRKPKHCIYRIDVDPDYRQFKWKPSIHMPRWACRIFLEITDVRVERLHDITPEQAIAEGVLNCRDQLDPDGIGYSEEELFSILWVSLHGHKNWRANPWVWVVEFQKVRP